MYWEGKFFRECLLDTKIVRLWGFLAGAVAVGIAVVGLIVEWIPARPPIVIFAIIQYILHLSNIALVGILGAGISDVLALDSSFSEDSSSLASFTTTELLIFFAPLCGLTFFGILSMINTVYVAIFIFAKVEAGFTS